MKRYIISIDLDSSIEANSEQEALDIANQRIQDFEYTLNIVDTEKI